jgi:CO dehydrogenase maturation factor
MIATTPPSLESRFVTVREDDPLLEQHGTRSGNIMLIQGGTYEGDDVGVTCYHGKLEPVEMLFHHLLDTEHDIVVTDATAGLDSLGHSMGIVHDLIIYVVEPTRKSIDVYEAFMHASKDLGLSVRVVANKIRSDDDREYVTSRIPDVLAFVDESDAMRSFERTGAGMDAFIDENQTILERVRTELLATPKDWDAYYARLLAIHEKSAKAWFDAYHNSDISKQKDERFSYDKVIP